MQTKHEHVRLGVRLSRNFEAKREVSFVLTSNNFGSEFSRINRTIQKTFEPFKEHSLKKFNRSVKMFNYLRIMMIVTAMNPKYSDVVMLRMISKEFPRRIPLTAQYLAFKSVLQVIGINKPFCLVFVDTVSNEPNMLNSASYNTL
ncbi:hypothetical protein HELRODRAFT_169100 [Helobdella robusta]|uniref:Uncharacterized protein n=1 Tax=Helobdella robusta TaxID=6412 RepID=T1F1E3_HELRO|nr:hypothetical protein HELRODRAFT_169100 [Helobdella robusta]ESO09156.1 hypothetical protein HELRODRAFT_169100 [Helobdella robusta]